MNEEINAIVEEIKADVEKIETLTHETEIVGAVKVVNGNGAVQGAFNTMEEAVAFATETGFKVLEDVVEVPVEVVAEAAAPVEAVVEETKVEEATI